MNGKTLNDSDSGFWSAATADAFNTTVQTCMADFAANVTQGPFTGSDDAVHYVMKHILTLGVSCSRYTGAVTTSLADFRFNVHIQSRLL